MFFSSIRIIISELLTNFELNRSFVSLFLTKRAFYFFTTIITVFLSAHCFLLFFRNFSKHFSKVRSLLKLVIFSYLSNGKKSPIIKNILFRKNYCWNIEILCFSYSKIMKLKILDFFIFFRNFSKHFFYARFFLKMVIFSYIWNRKKYPIMKNIVFRKCYCWNFEILFFSYSKIMKLKIFDFFIFFEISVNIFPGHDVF